MTIIAPPHHRLTAEWKCTRCGVTNRTLVTPGQYPVRDRCVTCHARHEVRPGLRPPFWQAAPSS
jgi:hypothetical protein